MKIKRRKPNALGYVELRAHLATLTPAQRKQRVSAALRARGVL